MMLSESGNYDVIPSDVPISYQYLFPMLKCSTMTLRTYSRESIYPIWNFVPGQPVADILAEMVAVLNDQMIGITIIIYRVAFHELSDLNRVQTCCAHKY